MNENYLRRDDHLWKADDGVALLRTLDMNEKISKYEEKFGITYDNEVYEYTELHEYLLYPFIAAYLDNKKIIEHMPHNENNIIKNRIINCMVRTMESYDLELLPNVLSSKRDDKSGTPHVAYKSNVKYNDNMNDVINKYYSANKRIVSRVITDVCSLANYIYDIETKSDLVEELAIYLKEMNEVADNRVL